MPLANPVYIEAPQVAPAPGGLYAVARVLDNADPHIGASGATYLSENCGVASGIEDPACITQEDRAEKTFDQIDVISGDPFAVYKGVQCNYLGDDDTEWARRGLELSEHIAVEQGVMAGVLQGATDITPTPGTPVSVRVGIAMLEGYAAANYGPLPTLHMTRTAASLGLASESLHYIEGHTILTKQGAFVANGGGYEINLSPAGVEADPGETWMYVTGAVTVVRTPVVVNRVIPGTGANGGHLNNQYALAERMVAVTVECIKAAILVEVA